MSSGVPRINRASNVPRPPHPINPTRSLSFAPKTRSADTAVQAAIPALTEFFTNSRRFIVPRIRSMRPNGREDQRISDLVILGCRFVVRLFARQNQVRHESSHRQNDAELRVCRSSCARRPRRPFRADRFQSSGARRLIRRSAACPRNRRAFRRPSLESARLPKMSCTGVTSMGSDVARRSP